MNYFEDRLQTLTRTIQQLKEKNIDKTTIEKLEDERDHLLLLLIRD